MEQADLYRERFGDVEAMAGAIRPYRGMGAGRQRRRRAGWGAPTSSTGCPRPATASVPMGYVWGNRDAYLGRATAERTARYRTGDYRFVEVDGDHWLPERHPDLVAEKIRPRVLDR